MTLVKSYSELNEALDSPQALTCRVGGTVLAKVDYDLDMVSKSVIANNNEDLYPESKQIHSSVLGSSSYLYSVCIASGQLLSIADQSSLPYTYFESAYGYVSFQGSCQAFS